MTMTQPKHTILAVFAVLAALAVGCGGEEGPGDPNDPENPNNPNNPNDPVEPPPLPEPPPPSQWETQLSERRVDYPRALRSASIRLVGEFPTLDQILSVSTPDMAANKVAYETAIDSFLADPRFATQMVAFWRDALRLGGNGNTDTMAVFAAMLSVNDGSMLDLFTAKTGGCPTFDAGTRTFTAADCPATNAPGGHAGVLTNQQMIKAYWGPMSFRIGKWVQESFVCNREPSEVATPRDIGGGIFTTTPWPIESVARGPEARIDFGQTSVVCVNCHTSKNHKDPLWMNFDDDGVYQDTPQAEVPIPGNPKVTLADYIQPGEGFYWRFGGTPVTNLSELGTQIAADPAVAECMVARGYGNAMAQFDPVDGLAPIPGAVIADHVAVFKTSGYKFKEALRSIYKSDDVVKY
jgi:hypothetical protein